MRKKGWRRRLVLACLVLCVPIAAPGIGPEAAAAQENGEIGPETGLPMPRFVSLRTNSANARRGPGLDYLIDWEYVRRGLPVEVFAEYGNWRRVRDTDGLGGWVHMSLLSGIRTALVRSGEPVTLRSGSDLSDDARALVEPGVIVRIRECEENQCRVTAQGTDGWIDQSVLWGVREGEVVE